jgi:hypothetical protein
MANKEMGCAAAAAAAAAGRVAVGRTCGQGAMGGKWREWGRVFWPMDRCCGQDMAHWEEE